MGKRIKDLTSASSVAGADYIVIDSNAKNSAQKTTIQSIPIETTQLIGTIGTVYIDDGSITANKIQTNAITNIKLGLNAIGTTSIGDGVITTDKIVNGAITGDKLASNSVSGTKILIGSIGSGKLDIDAVNTINIKDDSITGIKIRTGTITTTLITDNLVTNIKLASNAIGTTSITDGAISYLKMAANSIITSAVSDNAITTSKILAGNITTTLITDNAITNIKLGLNAIGTTSITDGAITTAKLANGAVTIDKIASNSINADKISNLNVITAKIADGAVTTDKIAAGNITTTLITDGAITTAKLSVNTINELNDNYSPAYKVTKNGSHIVMHGSNKSAMDIITKHQVISQLTEEEETYISTSPKLTMFKKNALNMTFLTSTISGVTFTLNADKTITINGTATEDIRLKIADLILGANTQYTLSGWNTSATAYDYNSFHIFAGNIIHSTEQTKSFTTNSGMPHVSDAYIFMKSGITITNLIFSLQLELGATATAFEAYNGISYSPTLANPVNGYGTTYDEVNWKTGIVTRKTHKLIFTGATTEDWRYSGVSNVLYLQGLSSIYKAPGGTGGVDGICTHYPVTSGGTEMSITTPYQSDGWIRIWHPTITNPDVFKTFLKAQFDAGTPVTFVYKLLTPITENFTPIRVEANPTYTNFVSNGVTNTIIYNEDLQYTLDSIRAYILSAGGVIA